MPTKNQLQTPNPPNCHELGLKPDRLQRLISLVVRGTQLADYSVVCDVRCEILFVSGMFRGDMACLIRSVAAMLSVQAARLRADVVRRRRRHAPFAAHAWIEADNRIVDEPIGASYLRTFYRVGASAWP